MFRVDAVQIAVQRWQQNWPEGQSRALQRKVLHEAPAMHTARCQQHTYLRWLEACLGMLSYKRTVGNGFGLMWPCLLQKPAVRAVHDWQLSVLLCDRPSGALVQARADLHTVAFCSARVSDESDDENPPPSNQWVSTQAGRPPSLAESSTYEARSEQLRKSAGQRHHRPC